MSTQDPMLSRQLWSAVANDDTARLRQLIQRGADVHIQGEPRAVGPGVQTGRDSLLDHAIEHRALHALGVLFEAGIRLRSRAKQGTEFVRLVSLRQPWAEGVRCFMQHRTTLTAVSNRDKEGWAAIHNAYAATGPEVAQAPEVIEHLMSRPGRWTPEDTRLAARTALMGRWPATAFDRWNQAGVPVVQHVQHPGMAAIWDQLSGGTWTGELGREWAQRLVDMGCPTPGPEVDSKVVAMVRDLAAQRHAPDIHRPRLRT